MNCEIKLNEAISSPLTATTDLSSNLQSYYCEHNYRLPKRYHPRYSANAGCVRNRLSTEVLIVLLFLYTTLCAIPVTARRSGTASINSSIIGEGSISNILVNALYRASSSPQSVLCGQIRGGTSIIASFVNTETATRVRYTHQPASSFQSYQCGAKEKRSLELSLFHRKGQRRRKGSTPTPSRSKITNFLKGMETDSAKDDNLSKLVFGSDDALFGKIEENQKTAPLGPSFGRFLDAGTGSHSLRWIASLIIGNDGTGDRDLQYTAVTADNTMRRNVLAEAQSLGIDDKGDVVIGNWKTEEGREELCHGEKYDTILADYLVGAIDGFSPYYQDQIFPRLAKHLKKGGRIYVVGLNPIPDKIDGDGDLFCRVTKLRDACILLASHRCYREYPPDWIERHMKSAGLKIVETATFPINYSHQMIARQLNVARSKLPLFASKDVAKAMGEQIDELERESRMVTGRNVGGKIQVGFDYVVTGEMPIDGSLDGEEDNN